MNQEWLDETRKLDMHWPARLFTQAGGSLPITIFGLPVETRDDGGCPHLEPAPGTIHN